MLYDSDNKARYHYINV